MRKRKSPPDERQAEMFQNLPTRAPQPKFKRIARPVWTKNKAKLIDRYLFYFVMITKHGTYIDGFAGPQNPSRPASWAAHLVLKSRPRFLRYFYLFDIDPAKAALLRMLKAKQKRIDPKRRIRVQCGDFNQKIKSLLKSRPIRPSQATFCLLDQRALECHWKTVQLLASYKGGEHNKIEIFYLLAVGWIHRSVAGVTRNVRKLERWWGGADWGKVSNLSKEELSRHFCDRFKDNLAYRYVTAWPIYKDRLTSRIMYYMIHASDHPQAAELMQRAYHNVVRQKEPIKQLALQLGLTEAQAIDLFKSSAEPTGSAKGPKN